MRFPPNFLKEGTVGNGRIERPYIFTDAEKKIRHRVGDEVTSYMNIKYDNMYAHIGCTDVEAATMDRLCKEWIDFRSKREITIQ
jgi:hypothetical protein